MALGKGEEWFLPSSLRRQEKIEVAKVQRGLDASGSDFGAYYALLKSGNTQWVREHAVIDREKAELYARQVVSVLQKTIAARERPLVLDVGCGPGAITDALRRQLGGSTVRGVDISESAVTYAMRHYPDCAFEVVGVDENTQFSSKFDLIHACEFYPFTRTHDIEIHLSYLQLFARWLSDDGAIVISLLHTGRSLANTVLRLSGALQLMNLSSFREVIVASPRFLRAMPFAPARILTRIARALLRRPSQQFYICSRLAQK